MVVRLAGRGGIVIPAVLRRRIEAKIAKMERILPKLTEARVVLATERHRHLADVTLRAKGSTLHAEGAAPDFQAAVDQALATLTAQIRRMKERVIEKSPRRSPRRAPAAGLPEAGEETPAIVVRRTSAKPMSLEEAVEQLRLRGDGLLVFRNARTRAVNVLQRRPDGRVELVEPGG